MGYFVGDTIRLELVSNDFEGDPLTGEDAAVSLTIHAKATDVTEVDAADMGWSVGDAAYTYDWDTADVPAGAYRLQAVVVSPQGSSVEVRTLVLAAVDPAP